MAKNGKPEDLTKINKLVAQYIALRTRMEQIEEQHSQFLKPFEQAKAQLTGLMLEFLDNTGQESAKTNEGTVFAAVRNTASLADPDAFMDYVMRTGSFELMDRRANSTACREFADENGELPPGVKINSLRYVNVRKPT